MAYHPVRWHMRNALRMYPDVIFLEASEQRRGVRFVARQRGLFRRPFVIVSYDDGNVWAR